MIDPWNPSPDEIRAWAHDAEAPEPCQDFDLALDWSLHEKAILECASDDACPKQDFFLKVLYLSVGNAVRTGFKSRPQTIVEGFIQRGSDYPNIWIQKWQCRSRELIKHPERFSYDDWCGGGIVRRDLSLE